MFTDEALLASDFDEAGYLRHALQVSTTSFDSEQTRLSRCLEKIETEIHATVQTNRDALIGSVQEVNSAQKTTNAILGTADQLSSSVRRIRHTIHEPYIQMEQRVHELRNVYSCLSLVRNVQRYLSVATKLRDSADGDLVRAARLLKELEDIQSASDFSGIPFIDSMAPSVAHAANTVRSRLSEALRSSIHNANPGELAVALQCSASMGSLVKTVQGLLAEIKREASRAIVKELDNASSTSGFGGTSGSMSEMMTADASFRDAIFTALEKALNQVSVQLRAFGHLWAVLRTRKDPATDVPYWWQLPNSERNAFDGVWTSIINQIKERLTKLSKRGSTLVAVSSEYGRLTILLRGFLNTVRETLVHVFFDGEEDASSNDEAAMSATIEDVVQKLSSDFEPRFRLALQDRLRERMSAVAGKLHTMRPSQGSENTTIDLKADTRLQQQSMTSGAAAGARNAPAMVLHPVASPIDPKSFFKMVTNEILSARSDDAVLAVVLKAVSNEIETFYKKCNDALKTLPVPELPKVSAGSTTASQLFHIQLANAASTFVTEMQNMSSLLPSGKIHSAATLMLSKIQQHQDPNSNSNIINSNSSGNSSNSSPLEQALSSFNRLTEALSKFVSQVSQPYFNAATIVLLQNIDSFVTDYYERGVSRPHSNALGSTVRARITDFAARYALLFDSRSGTVCARSCLVLGDKLIQRFVARMLIVRRGASVATEQYRAAVAEDCNALQEAVNILHPLDRLARRLSQLRAVRSLTQGTKSHADFDTALKEYIAAKFHPLVILLSTMQSIPAAASQSLSSQLKLANQQQFVAMIEVLLSLGGGSSLSSNNGSGDISSSSSIQTQIREASQWKVIWEGCDQIASDLERQQQENSVCEEIVIKRVRNVLKDLK